MICNVCDMDAKMRCTSSVPAGKRLVARTYKCPQCRSFVHTVEVPQGLFENLDVVEWRAIMVRLNAEKSKQIKWARLRKKKAQQGAGPPSVTGEINHRN